VRYSGGFLSALCKARWADARPRRQHLPGAFPPGVGVALRNANGAKAGQWPKSCCIDPLGGQAGLIALECSKFGCLTRVTLQDVGGLAR
jgi:hypothetical protein